MDIFYKKGFERPFFIDISRVRHASGKDSCNYSKIFVITLIFKIPVQKSKIFLKCGFYTKRSVQGEVIDGIQIGRIAQISQYDAAETR